MRDWQKMVGPTTVSKTHEGTMDNFFFHRHAMEILSVTGRWDGQKILEFGAEMARY